MAKYRIKTGSYGQPGGMDTNGNPMPGKLFRANTKHDVFETDRDMVAHNPLKYELVSEDVPVSQPLTQSASDNVHQEVEGEEEELDGYADPDNESLEAMTVPQLRKLAEEEEVDISGLKTKQEFVKALAAHFDA